MTIEAAAKEGVVRATLDLAADTREAAYGAAYVLMDRAWCAFEKAGSKFKLTLKPKDPALSLDELAKTFSDELATQKVRWAIAKNNLPVREFIVQQAILRAQGAAPAEAPPPDELSAEQKAEIDKLIAEVEQELRDLGQKRQQTDPKGISTPWEERNAR